MIIISEKDILNNLGESCSVQNYHQDFCYSINSRQDIFFFKFWGNITIFFQLNFQTFFKQGAWYDTNTFRLLSYSVSVLFCFALYFILWILWILRIPIELKPHPYDFYLSNIRINEISAEIVEKLLGKISM